MVKRFVYSFFLAVFLSVGMVSVAFAADGYSVVPDRFLPENIAAFLLSKKDATVLACDPRYTHVSYVSWISYDALSDMSIDITTSGRIVYNSADNAYYIVVMYKSDIASGIEDSYGALGRFDGYVYGARAPEGGDYVYSPTVHSSVVNTYNVYSSVTNDFLKAANNYLHDISSGIDKVYHELHDGIRMRIDNIYSEVYLIDNFNRSQLYPVLKNTYSRVSSIERNLGNIYTTLTFSSVEIVDRIGITNSKLDTIISRFQYTDANGKTNTVGAFLWSINDRIGAASSKLDTIIDRFQYTDASGKTNTVGAFLWSINDRIGTVNSKLDTITKRLQYTDKNNVTNTVASYLYGIYTTVKGFDFSKVGSVTVNNPSYDDTGVLQKLDSVINRLQYTDNGVTNTLTSYMAMVNGSVQTGTAEIVSALSNVSTTVNLTVEQVNNVEIPVNNTFTDIWNVGTDDEGNDETIVDTARDSAHVMGKLLSFLYNVAFKDAVKDDGIDHMNDFYLDVTEGVEDVWAS